MSVERKVAVITGASRGIGAALVKAYRERDYRVVPIARSIQPSADPDIAAVVGDIADWETAERAIAQAVERFGRVDTLVNNAGIFIVKPFTQYTAVDYAAMLGVNLAGFFRITQLAVAEMEKRGSGHIVQITTTLAEHALSEVPAMLASLTKGGLDAATRSLAIEYAKRGIRVNAVAPGIIKTPMHTPETYEGLGLLHPIGHMGEIADIATWKRHLSSRAKFCMSMAAKAQAIETQVIRAPAKCSPEEASCPSSQSKSPARVRGRARARSLPRKKRRSSRAQASFCSMSSTSPSMPPTSSSRKSTRVIGAGVACLRSNTDGAARRRHDTAMAD